MKKLIKQQNVLKNFKKKSKDNMIKTIEISNKRDFEILCMKLCGDNYLFQFKFVKDFTWFRFNNTEYFLKENLDI